MHVQFRLGVEGGEDSKRAVCVVKRQVPAFMPDMSAIAVFFAFRRSVCGRTCVPSQKLAASAHADFSPQINWLCEKWECDTMRHRGASTQGNPVARNTMVI